MEQEDDLLITSNLPSIPELSDSDAIDDCSNGMILKLELRNDRDF
jgi:hypothetical protein